MAPLISVIIPVYNVEKYIVECLESLKNQTFRNFEAIIVNDGTKDNSAVLAEEFIEKNELKDYRIIHKKNGGISTARNAGLDVAQGEWVFFLDSDDWLIAHALEILVDCLQRNPSDLIIGGYQAYDQISGKYEVWSNYPCATGQLPKDLGKLHSFSFCWGRLYKKEIIDSHHLRFDERILYAEDNAWQFDYLRKAKSFSYADEIVYNYRINRSDSSTGKLITPQMKYHVAEHMYSFYSELVPEQISDALKENPRLLSVTWGVFSTNITNDILDKEYRRARSKLHSDFGKTIIRVFSPRSKKEWLFLLLMRYSFAMLCIFVKIYYSNFEVLRRSRVLQVLSKRKK